MDAAEKALIAAVGSAICTTITGRPCGFEATPQFECGMCRNGATMAKAARNAIAEMVKMREVENGPA